MYNIYLGEDDPKIAALLKDHLEKYDYKVVLANGFADKFPKQRAGLGREF
ncbi:response regulator [Peribacillus glennii]|uniref:DNA-binding response regulator n=1 Tax=Peribacillus glennii TaxID=2303991 RepID=A0A372LB53_9BACI|nr:response regulator transcription factor [Peribacillus glennii]RFU63009.1 DNA-binding response regulator [Peribacillus glennii]